MSGENKFDLSGKKALITGGSRGLGLAIAKAFVSYNARVIITGRNKEQLEIASAELGENCRGYIFDLENISGIPGFAANIGKEHGTIDILVNNAGVHFKKEALAVDDEAYEEVIRINQQAVFALSREFGKMMVARKKGVILMISSMAAQYGIPKVIAYTAAKSAVEGMTRGLAVELSPAGVRVNCIAPGFIETDMSAKALNSDPERKARVLARTPMGRLGKPEDVALAAVYLASDAADFLTGVVLPVDGGNVIGF